MNICNGKTWKSDDYSDSDDDGNYNYDNTEDDDDTNNDDVNYDYKNTENDGNDKINDDNCNENDKAVTFRVFAASAALD